MKKYCEKYKFTETAKPMLLILTPLSKGVLKLYSFRITSIKSNKLNLLRCFTIIAALPKVESFIELLNNLIRLHCNSEFLQQIRFYKVSQEHSSNLKFYLRIKVLKNRLTCNIYRKHEDVLEITACTCLRHLLSGFWRDN